MNAKTNAKGAFIAITHPNVTVKIDLWFRNIIITGTRTVNRGVMDVQEHETCERIKIHAVPLVRYMGKGTTGLQQMRVQFEVENQGIAIPTQVRWLARPRTMRERRKTSEIAVSSVVFVTMRSRLVQSLIKKVIKAVGLWYHVEAFTNEGADSRCELCSGWGHIETSGATSPSVATALAITVQATVNAM
jgi:hypothetical protein